MAFDYAKHHVKYFYNPKTGASMPCESLNDEARIKGLGFTSGNYVPSKWPTTLYHQKTGEARSVGKLEWEEAKNAAAVAALGPDWGSNPVDPPEPKPKAEAPEGAGFSALAMLELVGEIKALREQMADIETAVTESAARIAQLEAVIADGPSVADMPTIEESEAAEEVASGGGKKKR